MLDGFAPYDVINKLHLDNNDYEQNALFFLSQVCTQLKQGAGTRWNQLAKSLIIITLQIVTTLCSGATNVVNYNYIL